MTFPAPLAAGSQQCKVGVAYGTALVGVSEEVAESYPEDHHHHPSLLSLAWNGNIIPGAPATVPNTEATLRLETEASQTSGSSLAVC